MPSKKRGGKQRLRFARVPTGKESCGYCYMLAARGYVYTSKESALKASHEGCDCLIVPQTQDVYYSDIYDPEWMQKCFKDCCDTVDWDSVVRIAQRKWDKLPQDEQKQFIKLDKKTQTKIKALPEDVRKRIGLDDDSLNKSAFDNYCDSEWLKEVFREIERRDENWLYNKIEPSITYASKSWEDEIKRSRPWEIKTAQILKSHGFRCDFWFDYERYEDASKLILQIGLTDLSDGTELKALCDPKGTNAVNSAMRGAGHKKGIKCCVIDNQYGKLNDNAVIKEIFVHQHGRHVDNVLLIKSNGSLLRLIY